MEQLNLFENIKKTSIPRQKKVLFDYAGKYDAFKWLQNIIDIRPPLIFLYGQNPHLVWVRCHQNWESHIFYLVKRTWLCREIVIGELENAGYRRFGTYRNGYNGEGIDFAIVYRK